MEATCIDNVFGEMSYKHRWCKKQSISMFGEDWTITIAAKAYSGKPITEEQQKAYSYFMNNEKRMMDTVGEQLKSYVNENLSSLAEYWISARTIVNISELAQMVTPKTLLFKQDGTTIMLLDCVWDIEGGMAVKLAPNIVVGSQDLFL
ncbi:DUF6985 domain-containing protein [Blautia marasmi]|uniref:DUF6985 domain-containing protein n=1 Tax=Blautia marasmi TaxID=1917868 RepID=UPI000CF2F676|nr:hypothetical protein [Blautia marasmi]